MNEQVEAARAAYEEWRAGNSGNMYQFASFLAGWRSILAAGSSQEEALREMTLAYEAVRDQRDAWKAIALRMGYVPYTAASTPTPTDAPQDFSLGAHRSTCEVGKALTPLQQGDAGAQDVEEARRSLWVAIEELRNARDFDRSTMWTQAVQARVDILVVAVRAEYEGARK